MFKSKQKKELEFPIGAIRVLPDWNGKFCIEEYYYCSVLHRAYYIRKCDNDSGHTLYFDTKEDAIKRIEFMGKKDKYNDL